jgi:hypothetical protein
MTIIKFLPLIFLGWVAALALESQAATIRIRVANETFKTIVIHIDSVIYKRPQVETLLPKQTRSISLEDYSDKDITKSITIEAHQTSGESASWSFTQTDLRTNMKLIFSDQDGAGLKLTVIRPNGIMYTVNSMIN